MSDELEGCRSVQEDLQSLLADAKVLSHPTSETEIGLDGRLIPLWS
jgi:hypothetical protein